MPNVSASLNLMKRLISMTILLALFFPLHFGLAQAAVESQNGTYVMCRSHKDVRTIRVEFDKEDQECKTLYTKAGVDQEVGNGRNLNSCKGILSNIKNNLEGAAWACKDISKSQISHVSSSNE